MTRSNRTTLPHLLIVGLFIFLLAIVLAVAPLPLLVRSLGIVLCFYAAFTFTGLPFAFATALLAPLAGLLTGSGDWLVMLPLLLVSGLLALLGLDYAWRTPALIVSPLLYILPQIVAWQLSQRSLFAVALPWQPSAPVWLGLHALVAVLGTLAALSFNRAYGGPRRRE